MDLSTLTKKVVLNLIYPPLCVICGKKLISTSEEDLSVCSRCLNSLKRNRPPYCRKCGRSLYETTNGVDTCWECFGRNFYYERAWSCFLYEGVAKEALHLLKYSRKLSLSNFFSSSLLQFIRNNYEIVKNIDAVLAVPLHNTKLREREFNQAGLLSAAISKEFDLKDISGCLKRSVPTRPQSELDKKERFSNVKGTFEVVRADLAVGKNILMVDDLFTTGATLNECAKVLKKAGAGKIHCLTFARGA